MMGINWDEIDNVMLDMDGTLLDLHFDNFFWLTYLPEHYAKKFPGQEEKARHWMTQQLKYRRGSLEWYCTDFWTKELDIEIIALKQEVSHLINERPHVMRFLTALAVAKKNRMLVTNAHPKSVELKFSKTQISSLLDCVITSHDYGHPKESQKFWHKFARDYQFDPKKTLFIDDSISVLRAAREFGIKYILCIDSPDSMLQTKPCKEFPSISHFNEILNATGGLSNAQNTN